MLGMRHIDWVQSMLVPWIVFFALAAVASAFSILSKLHFFVGKMCSNFAHHVYLSASAMTVNDALAENDFNTRKIYSYACTCTEAPASVRRHASTRIARLNRYMVVGLCEESVLPRWRGRKRVTLHSSADAMTLPPSRLPEASQRLACRPEPRS
jgi:hypothetical protein